MHWRGVPAWVVGQLVDMDSWLIDSVFQRLANRLADHNITTFRLAKWCFAITPLPRIAALLITLDWSNVTGPLAAAGFFGCLFSLGISIWYIRNVQADEDSGSNVWVLPKSRVNFFFLRLVMLGLAIFDSALHTIPGALTWYSNLGDFLFLCGLYIWACRPRPPSRRHAPAPSSSNTERAS